jgi:5-methylcytosine-specific restriction enzyme A
MATTKRSFRSQESLEAEKASRELIGPFLQSRGFAVIDDRRSGQSQVITATDPAGDRIRLNVRLCWRWGRGKDSDKYSASQIRARLSGNDWVTKLEEAVARDASKGLTHSLFVQPNESSIVYAALVPIRELPAIWNAQREAYDKLIRADQLGSIRKNPAVNGDSPSLWLMDARNPAARAATDVVWNWPSVVNVGALRKASDSYATESDDSVDDIAIDFSTLGNDGAPRVISFRSSVKRDQAVRRAVLSRATKGCESASCGDTRFYPGFLDVHHILGAEVSDRYWNCVALCPNCHREAHFSPTREQLNADLLAFALQFRPRETK